VVTGRSRLAIYLARIPAGLAIVVPLVAVGFTIVCAVCVFAAPTSINYDGTNVPANLSLSAFEHWAGEHPDTVICNFPYKGNITATSGVDLMGRAARDPVEESLWGPEDQRRRC